MTRSHALDLVTKIKRMLSSPKREEHKNAIYKYIRLAIPYLKQHKLNYLIQEELLNFFGNTSRISSLNRGNTHVR